MSTTDLEVDVDKIQVTGSTAELAVDAPTIVTLPTQRYPSKVSASLLVWTIFLSSLPVDTSWGDPSPAEEPSVQMERPDLFRSAGVYYEKLTGRARLARHKAMHFDRQGREERIARALLALNMPGPTFTLDYETWKWIAQEAEIEDF